MAKAYINILSILAGDEDQYIDTHLETRAPDRTRNRPETDTGTPITPPLANVTAPSRQ